MEDVRPQMEKYTYIVKDESKRWRSLMKYVLKSQLCKTGVRCCFDLYNQFMVHRCSFWHCGGYQGSQCLPAWYPYASQLTAQRVWPSPPPVAVCIYTNHASWINSSISTVVLLVSSASTTCHISFFKLMTFWKIVYVSMIDHLRSRITNKLSLKCQFHAFPWILVIGNHYLCYFSHCVHQSVSNVVLTCV